jgi:hypothetical protein
MQSWMLRRGNISLDSIQTLRLLFDENSTALAPNLENELQGV